MSEEVDARIHQTYRLVKRLGRGSYGIVWRAEDKATGEVVAIKKCFDCFQNGTDSQRTFREISLLKQLNGHPNIVQLYDVVPAQSGRDMYIVCEFMDTDLGAMIRGNLLQPVHAKYVTYQLLAAAKFMHSAGVVHRDIKPANILIDGNCRIKVCDFGLARLLVTGPQNSLTTYVATRWYRAPEILLSHSQYGFPVDLWAIGAIVAEMLQGKPLFPGTSSLDQLERIIQVTGWPVVSDSFEGHRLLSQINSRVEIKALCEILPKASTDALDFLRLVLALEPERRATAAEAIMHPFLIEFRTGQEPDCMRPVAVSVDDNLKLKPEQYQNILYRDLERRDLERRDLERRAHERHTLFSEA